MLRKNVNKKIYHSLSVIILTIIIFVGVTFMSDKSVSDRWLIKYKFVTNEKALIYLNNLDAMTQDFQIKVRKDSGLLLYVMKSIDEKIKGYDLRHLHDVYGVRISPNYIFLETKNIKDSPDDIFKIIKDLNKKIKNDLTIKLNLYINIAEDRVDEENAYLMSQMSKIAESNPDQLLNSSSDNNVMLSVEDYLNYIKEKLIESNQEITISNMQEILRQLNINASSNSDFLNELRLRNNYIIGGISNNAELEQLILENNIKLDQLKKRSKELLNMVIVKDGYIAESKNIKKPLLKKIIIASLLGLVISLIYVYFYLTVSLRLLKKRLTFLLYQEK